MNLIFWIVLLAYASLLVELFVFPVPSVASSRRLAGQNRHSLLKGSVHALRALIVAAFIFLPLLIVLFPGIAHLSMPIVSPTPPLAIAFGTLLILAGRILSMGTALLMRQGQKPFHGQEPKVLITGRFFRYSRNPIIVGLLLMYIGLTFLLPHLLLGVGIVAISMHMHEKVRMEETHLERLYGPAFRDYCKRTRRYV